MSRNASGSIVAGGTPQSISNTDPARGFFIQNLDSSESLFIREDGGTASTSDGASIEIPAKGIWESPSFWSVAPHQSRSVSVVAATTGHKFSARWY